MEAPCCDPEALLRRAEAAGEPAVFRGLCAAWPALSRWTPAYLEEAAGSAPVQAMASATSDFFGDFEHHQEVDCTLGELLQQAEQQQWGQRGQPERAAPHLYLAQQSLQDPALAPLLADAPPPPLLAGRALAATNLWLSGAPSRSSLHYDPYENLLCVVAGSKRVRLHPPAAALGLYPRPLGGEAANHAGVSFAAPDWARHPLYRHVVAQCLEVELRPGDALYLPEGWWHQVDSAGMTLAVNFWWASPVSQALQARPHQAHFYLRQLLAAATGEAVAQLLDGIQPWRRAPLPPGHCCCCCAQQQQQPREEEEEGQGQAGAAQRAGEGAAGDAAGGGGGSSSAGSDQHHQPCGEQAPLQQPALAGAGEGSIDAGAAAAAAAAAAGAGPGRERGEQQVPAAKRARLLDGGRPAQPELDGFEQAALEELLSQCAAPQPPSPPLQQQQQQQRAGSAAAPHACCQQAPADATGQDMPQQQQKHQEPGGQEGQQQQQQCGMCSSGLLADAAWWRRQARAQQQLLAAATASQQQQQQQQAHDQDPDGTGGSSGGGGSSADPLGLCGGVARLLAALQPAQLLRVLWAATRRAPDAVAALLLRGLTPAAAQLLTRGFEAADGLFEQQQQQQQGAGGDGGGAGGAADGVCLGSAGGAGGGAVAPVGVSREAFYGALYGTVADSAAVLQALLRRQVALSAAAAGVVVRAHLGGEGGAGA